jgi:hypothetical protein
MNSNLESLKAEIRDLHRITIDAHWEKDVDFFVRDLAEGYFSVGGGEIRHPTVEQIRAQFTDYLTSTTFSEYRDLREPIVGISQDGSLAWSLVEVKVAGVRKLADGSERVLDFICAWITLYQREGDKWLRMGEVSSFREASED